MKKKHWTQTPAGRKIMVANARNRKRKPNSKGKIKVTFKDEEIASEAVLYSYAYIYAKLEEHAQRFGIPVKALAQRVSQMLRAS